MNTVISPPKPLKPWLDATGSITQMAKQCCDTVKLRLIQTGWGLKENGEMAYTREILMMCDGAPWWYAHTELPQKTFKQRKGLFDRLGENSLGCVLFSDPEIMREALDYFPVTSADSEFKQASRHVPLFDETLWARHSLYSVSDSPLYLLEVFLPRMLNTIC